MATTTVEAAAAGGQEAPKTGMPQLDFSTFPNQIFWLVVALVVIYLVLNRVALPRIAGILTERQSTITKDLAAAEALKEKALEAERVYNQALIDARAAAAAIVAAARAEMKAEVDKAMAKADAEIGARAAEGEKRIAEIRAGAAAAVGVVAKDTTAALIAALGGRADAKAVTAAVAARMKG